METDEKVRDENIQYGINREAVEIAALSSGKIDKYPYLTGEETLFSDQSRIIEQAKFIYYPLRKAWKKQTKKQVDTLKSLKLSNNVNELKQIESKFSQNQIIGSLIA